MKVDNECGKQEACVSLENQVLLAVNHNNSITSNSMFEAYRIVKWGWQLSIIFMSYVRKRTVEEIWRFRFLMPRSHIHGSPPRFYYGFNLTDDPGNANFRSPIRMHYIRMIKYYYVWLRMQYGKLRTNTNCHECTPVANPASSPWMCDLGIIIQNFISV